MSSTITRRESKGVDEYLRRVDGIEKATSSIGMSSSSIRDTEMYDANMEIEEPVTRWDVYMWSGSKGYHSLYHAAMATAQNPRGGWVLPPSS